MKILVLLFLLQFMGCAKAVFTAAPEREISAPKEIQALPTPRVPEIISGIWEFKEPMRTAPFLINVRIQFLSHTMKTTIDCADGKNKISKTLSVLSRITESEIQALESKDFKVAIPNSPYFCGFRINSGDTYLYSISADGQSAQMSIALNPAQGSKTLVKIN